MKILHIITDLDQGGAERQLANLLAAGTKGAVFSILDPGVMASVIKASRVPIYSGSAQRTSSPTWLKALRHAIKDYQPDLIMGWMYHGNIAASITPLLGYRGAVLWNIRHSVHDLALEKSTTRWIIKAGSWLSSHPKKIIYNSATASSQHEALPPLSS